MTMKNNHQAPYCVYAYHGLFRNEYGGSMHLAVQKEDKAYTPLNNAFGVLFPKADFNEGKLSGTTKTIKNPWIFRMSDGSFGVVALRRSLIQGENLSKYEEAPEAGEKNGVLFFRSHDLLSYSELGLFEVAPEETKIIDVSCRWCENEYLLLLRTDNGNFQCTSIDLVHFGTLQPTDESPKRINIGLFDAAPACEIAVTPEEYNRITASLTPLQNVLVKPIEVTASVGEKISLPNAELQYNDGTVFTMPVKWEIPDIKKAGTYTVTGCPQQKQWPFPLMEERGDPMAIQYHDQYYFMATDDEHGQLALKIRIADTIDGLVTAEDHIILPAAKTGEFSGCLWAPELHLINDNLFVFFAAGFPYWYTVQCYVMKLTGNDPLKAEDWSKPFRCKTKDNEYLCNNGITLDTTVLQDNGDVYTIWAQREITDSKVIGTSDLYIAQVDPQKPWQQISKAVMLRRPSFGWERIHSEVNEGPFVLRHADDIFVTYACALIDYTYSVGLLKAKSGTNLLDPDCWEVQNYPALNCQSMPDQIGGGHNSFVKDEFGNDILMTHAIPLDHFRNAPEDIRRYPAFRTVHWDNAGLPRLDMTADRELNPDFSQITATVYVKQ